MKKKTSMRDHKQPSETKIEQRKKKTTPGKNYKYYILALGCLSSMIVMAIPNTSLSILMPDIREELNLTVAQVGVIWGIGSFPAMISGLFAGALGDRLGLKRIAIIACFMIGLARVLQGLAPSYTGLILSIVLAGLAGPFLMNNMIKVIALWFTEDERSMSTGMFSVGMAIGFLVGSMLSGTVLAPWLGSWRYVFVFFGALSFLLILPWSFSQPQPPRETNSTPDETSDSKSIFTGLLHVIKIPEMWLLGFSGIFISGSIYALLGYLPLHFKALEWEATIADSAVALIYLIGMIAVLPISFWAEKAGKQKLFMIILACITITGFAVFAFARGSLVWFGIILIGLVRDAYMSISTAVMLKSKGLNFDHLGSASSFRMILTLFGFLLAPMIGNKLAGSSTSAPFVFWGVFACVGVVFLFFIPSNRSESETS